MKAKVSISEFRDALQVASLTLSKRLGSSSNALMYLQARTETNSLYLLTFDGIARTLVKLPGEVEEAGRTVINPTLLISSLSHVIREGQLTIQQGDKKDSIKITGAGRKMEFAASGELENFESVLKTMPLSTPETFVISAATFKNLIKHSAPFVDRPDKENAAEFYRGDANLLIKAVETGFEACATEGKALAVVRVNDKNVSNTAEDLKIPLRSVVNLNKMLDRMKGQDVKVIIVRDEDGSPRHLNLRTDNIFYGTTLDVSKFRDYQKILDYPINRRVQIAREYFQALIQNAIGFVGTGGKEDEKTIDLTFWKNKLRIQAGSGKEKYEEEIEVSEINWPSGNEGVPMSFSPQYLTNIARVISGETVVIHIAQNTALAFFTSEKDDINTTYAVAKFVKPGSQTVPAQQAA